MAHLINSYTIVRSQFEFIIFKLRLLLIVLTISNIAIAQNIKSDTDLIYHIEDSIFREWQIKRYTDHPELRGKLDPMASDSIKKIMSRRNRNYYDYSPTGYDNTCNKIIQAKIDEIIRNDTLNKKNKKAHTIGGVIKAIDDE